MGVAPVPVLNTGACEIEKFNKKPSLFKFKATYIPYRSFPCSCHRARNLVVIVVHLLPAGNKRLLVASREGRVRTLKLFFFFCFVWCAGRRNISLQCESCAERSSGVPIVHVGCGRIPPAL